MNLDPLDTKIYMYIKLRLIKNTNQTDILFI